MTPKEKAEDLVNTFRVVLMNEDTECGNEILCTMIAIEHAKICVSEIQEHAEMKPINYKGYTNAYFYFIKVRCELNNM